MRKLDPKEMAGCFATGVKAVPSVTGRLKVSDGKLCDAQGNEVQLKGLSTHSLSWYPLYINQEFFNEMAAVWNCNAVRLAMYTAELDGYCEGGDQKGLKQLIREGVAYAKEADMYVIVDWHILHDYNPNMNVEAAVAFFDEMAGEFAGQEHVIYEICNEPNSGCSWSEVKRYAERVIPVIRNKDPEGVILVGTPTWSQDVDKALNDPITGVTNLMYTLHFYATTHKEELREKMKAALKGGLPIYVSEYGLCDASGDGGIDIEEAKKWYALMDENKLSYMAWNISYRDETSAIFKPDDARYFKIEEENLTQHGKILYNMLTGKSIG
ncbi:MAG: glycoside hydrolase family 5 protein [Lachnospiraceae bacterium]|nr:glycoside hydrolase family 5 protein [Lachnospiraceae bacterium]